MLTSLSADRSIVTIDALSGEPVPDLADVARRRRRLRRQGGRGLRARPRHRGDRERRVPSGATGRASSASARCCESRSHRGRGTHRVALLPLRRRRASTREDDVDVARRVADHVASRSPTSASPRRSGAPRRRASARRGSRRACARSPRSSTPRAGYRRVVGDSARGATCSRRRRRSRATETTVLLTGESGTGKEVVARLHPSRLAARATGRSSRSTARRCPSSCSSPSCSATSRAPSRARPQAQAGTHRAGRRRRAVPRRGRRDEPAGAGEVPARAAGARVPAPRRHAPHARPTCASSPRPTATCAAAIARGDVPRGPLLPAAACSTIRLPPLRERPRATSCRWPRRSSRSSAASSGGPPAGISRDAREALLALLAGRATSASCATCSSARRSSATAGSSPPSTCRASSGPRPSPPVRRTGTGETRPGLNLETVERDLIVKALEASGNNRSQAARLLGIARPQLYHRLKKYGLDVERAG